jgi:hypothetical protein
LVGWSQLPLVPTVQEFTCAEVDAVPHVIAMTHRTGSIVAVQYFKISMMLQFANNGCYPPTVASWGIERTVPQLRRGLFPLNVALMNGPGRTDESA